MKKINFISKTVLIASVIFVGALGLPRTIFAETITFGLYGSNSAWGGTRSSIATATTTTETIVGNEADFISNGYVYTIAPYINSGTFTTDFRIGVRVCENPGTNCGMGWTNWASDSASQGFDISSAPAVLVSADPSHNRFHYVTTYLQTRPLPAGVQSIQVQIGERSEEADYVFPNDPQEEGAIAPHSFTSDCGGSFTPAGGGTGPYVGAEERLGTCRGKIISSDLDVIELTIEATARGVQYVADNIPRTFSSGQTLMVGSDSQPLYIAAKNISSVAWPSDQSTLVPGSQTGTCPTEGSKSGSCSATYIYSSSKIKLKHVSGSFTPSSDPASYSEPVKVTTSVVFQPPVCGGAGNALNNLLSIHQAFAMQEPCNPNDKGTYTTETIYSVNGVTVASPDIQPGQTADFSLDSLTAPSNGVGSYTEVWQAYDASSNSTFGDQMPITITIGNSINVISVDSQTGEAVTSTWQFIPGASAGNPCGGDGTCSAGTSGSYSNQPVGTYTLTGIEESAGPNFVLSGVREIAQVPVKKESLSFADLIKQIFAPRALAMSTCDADAIIANGGYPINQSTCPANQPVQALTLASADSNIDFAVTWDPIATMQVSPSSFSFSATEGGSPSPQVITIQNTGGSGSKLQWSASSNASWLSLAPSIDNKGIPAGMPETPLVTINSSALSPGTYHGAITITGASLPTNKTGYAQSIPVTLTIASGGNGGGTTHLACVGNACTIVAGAGANQNGCSVTGALCGGGSTHLACVNSACAIVSGGGTNENSCSAVGTSCSGGGGSSPSCTFFTVNKSQIVPPQTATLSWDCSGLSSCSINQGVGSVLPIGSQIVAPTSTTPYTLTCSGGGSFSEDVTVTVNNPGLHEINP